MSSNHMEMLDEGVDTQSTPFIPVNGVSAGLHVMSMGLVDTSEQENVVEQTSDTMAQLSNQAVDVSGGLTNEAIDLFEHDKVDPAKKEGKDGRSIIDILPPEVCSKIFRLALTADNGRIELDHYWIVKPPQSLLEENHVYMPYEYLPGKVHNVGINLLCTSHQIYHVARDFLYSENELVFSQLGHDVWKVFKPLGLGKCVPPYCTHRLVRPNLNRVTLRLGHFQNPDDGEGNIVGMAAYIGMCSRPGRGWTGPLEIKHLTLSFSKYAWTQTFKPRHFTNDLLHVRVTETLVLEGSMVFAGPALFMVDEDLKALPKALHMSPKPVTLAAGRVEYVLDMTATEEDWETQRRWEVEELEQALLIAKREAIEAARRLKETIEGQRQNTEDTVSDAGSVISEAQVQAHAVVNGEVGHAATEVGVTVD
ncbi:hypothetical protein MMC24_006735 [Lignoscripta atroalba]|nr:hypothetical protein [Lignoscripta atroalba]